MATAPTPITTPPTVPDRGNAVAFPAQMYAAFQYLFGAFYDGLAALASNVYNNAVIAEGVASAADSAAAAADVTQWISGTTYAAGQMVWSPANFHTYRRRTAGAGTTDPASDPTNWKPISVDVYNIQTISTNTTAAPFKDYILTASLVLTLPASPVAGDWVGFKNKSGTTTATLDPGSNKIEGVSGIPTIDIHTLPLRVIFKDATDGWVFI